jgi:DNA-binding MarR family transcriptional regulator
MSARETAELLLLVGRLVQADGYDGELSPAQWMALRFFARANSFSRTPSAFAEFQATTRGTTSQAVKALEAGGYLVRQRSQADGRSVTLRLTHKGHEAAARDPFEVLVRAVDSLDAQEQAAMRDALHHVLTTVAANGAHPHFGGPGLRVSRWRNTLRLDESEPIGPRVPTVRRSDRARSRWSPLRSFSAEERAPRRRTSRMSSATAICWKDA